jgi:hypothetical protein
MFPPSRVAIGASFIDEVRLTSGSAGASAGNAGLIQPNVSHVKYMAQYLRPAPVVLISLSFDISIFVMT